MRILLAFFSLFAIMGAAAGQTRGPEQAIRAVLDAQQAAWNRGDIRGFMDGYEDSAETTFVGNTVTKGRAAILERYLQRYGDRRKMGTLAFSGIEVRRLVGNHAAVIGKWRLTREADAGGDAGGLFTLVFSHTGGGWKIILDHTG